VEAAAEPTTVDRLPATLRLGPVRLRVASLDRSVPWYESALGLRLHRRDGDEAELGDGAETVVLLHEDPQARPAGRHAGLYHYALLYPSREELAWAARRLALARTPIQGMSDHGTHEAIYLPDPDGNGIELAADRARDRWPDLREELARGGPRPLDIDSLLAAVPEDAPPAHVADGLRVGHLHLHVGDIDEALAFYRDALGFAEQMNMGSAAFLSAGGYHHHLGVNVWRGVGVGPPPEQTAGLERWTIELPGEDDVAAARSRLAAAGIEAEDVAGGFLARDPWRTAVAVVANGAPS
jgi:catechol 2,3-dioxygenase